MTSPKLVIVDDDADFRAPIRAILAREGMIIEEASSGAELEQVLSSFDADMVLLDVNLPDDSGLNIAHRIKQNHKLDVVMLSALGQVNDRVNGLNSGADYYLPKPVDMRELLAVINNRFAQQKTTLHSHNKVWKLDVGKWILISPDEVEYALNSSEFALLQVLASHSQLAEPASREALYQALGKPDYSPLSRSLDLHISRMRQRFTSTNQPFPIKTIRNVGYELTEPMTLL